MQQLESGEALDGAFESRILKEREEWTNRMREALQRKRDAEDGFVERIRRDETERERPRKSTIGLLMVAGGCDYPEGGTSKYQYLIHLHCGFME